MGLFWECYRFFYWLLQSCARDWVSVVKTALWDCFGNAIASFIGYYKVARETGSVLCQTALWDCFGNAIASSICYYKVARDWVSVVSNCTMGLFWECYRFFYWLFTKLCAILGQCCVKLHCRIVWERYRLFYWLLRSCAGNWFGVTPNQHHGIVVGMLSFPLRPLKRLPQRLSLKHNLQMAQTERSEKGIDEHISPQKICPKSNQHQCSPNINMH